MKATAHWMAQWKHSSYLFWVSLPEMWVSLMPGTEGEARRERSGPKGEARRAPWGPKTPPDDLCSSREHVEPS